MTPEDPALCSQPDCFNRAVWALEIVSSDGELVTRLYCRDCYPGEIQAAKQHGMDVEVREWR